MSWFSDKIAEGVRGTTKQYQTSLNFLSSGFNDISKYLTGGTQASNLISSGVNDVSKFLESENQKADLRGAETESFLSGVPIVGDMLRGVNGVQQLEDLYNNTGKVSAYPAAQNLGASGIGYGLQSLARKIENGSNDLYQYYAGEPDQWSANMYN